MTSRRTPRGMTMIEIIVASTIFALVISLSFGISHWTSKSFKDQLIESTLTDKGEKALKMLHEELSDARLVSDPQPVNTNGFIFQNAELQFQVPLRYKHSAHNPKGHTVFIEWVEPQVDPETGKPLNPPMFRNPSNNNETDYQFSLRYGWRDMHRFVGNGQDNNRLVPLQGPGLQVASGHPLPTGVTVSSTPFTVDDRSYPAGTLHGGYIRFRFVMNTQIRMGKYGRAGIIREYEEKIDFDGDGSFSSSFALGYLERSYLVGPKGDEQLVPESRVAIGDTVILQPLSSTGATNSNEAGQLKSNRIFWTGTLEERDSRLEIYLWLLSMDASGQPHLQRCTTTLFLRNNSTYVRSATATGTDQ